MMGLMIFSCTITGLLLLLFAHLLINLLSVRRLRTGLQKGTLDEPFVSLLVPARNEEASIEMCVYSLLKQRYERLEVLVLDDRSSDATASIVQRIIDALPLEQKERLQLFYGEALPPGWVGKNFACHQLFQHARGDYLFFTDADTVHAPEMVRAVIERMRGLNVDLLTAQLGYELQGIGERMIVPLLYFRVFTLLPLTLVSRRPEPILAVGNGPLLCLCRTAYAAVGGHQAIKGCILEDVSLARAVKAAGYRMAFVDAVDMIYCHMYTSFANTWVGFSRTFFAFYNYSPLAALAIILLDLALFVAPPLLLLLSLIAPLPPIVVLLALSNYSIAVMMRLLLALRFARFQKLLALLLCFLHPVAIILGCLILLNSMHWHYRKRGTAWKGRYYSS
ncbi:MAG TPA: glycosyltransferase [Ktedonosporobacter sp.]|jgi:chlorobactene glucosyltransferase|nr:glycosyltransferase [Ktedonosporobacter sp.]